MPITLITGPANAGKARTVIDALRRHVARGQQPLLVVPTGADADIYRRELAEGGPVCGTRTVLFAGLIDQIALRAAASVPAREPLGPVARERLLAHHAARVWPHAARGGQGLSRALGRVVAELQVAAVEPSLLRGALAGEAEATRIGTFYERYVETLEETGRTDGEARARWALDALRRAPSLWRGAPVLFYGFDDLTALELDAIETLGVHVDAPVTVSLAYEPGRAAFAGRAWAFNELRPHAAEHVELPSTGEHYAPQARAALHHLERALFDPDAATVDPGGSVKLLEGISERDELELVAAKARDLIELGNEPSEIAIVHRHPASIAEALTEALDEAGVPHGLRAVRPFSHTALGRSLLGMLRCGCAAADPGVEATLGDLLSFLRAPGVLERADLADELEEAALRTGVTGAAGGWTLWESTRGPLDRLRRISAAAEHGARALIERAEHDLMWLFAAPRRGGAATLAPDQEQEADALRAALSALAQLRDLASMDERLLDGPEGVLQALSDLALPPLVSSPPDGVAVLDPLSLRARRVRALLLCGLQDGAFPAVASTEPILSEPLRAMVGERLAGPRFARREDLIAAERYLLYATVSRPQELLCVSWHAASDDGAATPPSLFLDDIRDLFDPTLWERRVRSAAAVGAPSGVRDTVVVPSGVRDAGPPPPVGDAVSAPSGVRNGVSGDRDHGPHLLRDERLLQQLRERSLWSASSLEQWAACPVRWFVERVLRAEGLDPEAEPLARGGLAHAALRDVLEGLRGETGSARITPQRLPAARRLLAEALERHAGEFPLSVSEQRMLGARRRLEADLGRYLDHAAEQGGSLEPAHLELPFGFPEEPDGLPALDLGEGIRLRGRIDRVDLDGAGGAVLYDYKSGRGGAHWSGAKWSREGRFQMALYMLAAQRLLGLRALGGLYQPLSGEDLRARGVIACDEGLDLPCVRTDSRPLEELEALVAETAQAALAAAREARAGMLEARPATCTPGTGGCMYKTICRCGG